MSSGTLAAIIQVLGQAGIDHMVAGSFASGYHGAMRTTHDIDLIVDTDEPRLRLLDRHIDHHRFYFDLIGTLELRDLGVPTNIIDQTNGWKVDLIYVRDRPFSRTEFARRQSAEIAGVSVAVATAEDTILSKLEWAKLGSSERQVRDASSIVAVKSASLDYGYLEY
jgi:hypothetical protein